MRKQYFLAKMKDVGIVDRNLSKVQIHYQNIQELTDSYSSGEQTPSTITQHFLDRIEAEKS